jgi:hypothetical protein
MLDLREAISTSSVLRKDRMKMTKPIKTIDVRPRVPEKLKPLYELSYNLYFAWNYDAEELFRRINPDLWEVVRKNPVEFLGSIKQEELESLVSDDGFMAHMERVKEEFDRYTSKKLNVREFGKAGRPFVVAYFTAECGVADCLPIYSGGPWHSLGGSSQVSKRPEPTHCWCFAGLPERLLQTIPHPRQLADGDLPPQ